MKDEDLNHDDFSPEQDQTTSTSSKKSLIFCIKFFEF